MKQEAAIYVFLIILALSLSGCGLGGSGNTSDPTTDRYYQGSEGVQVTFEGNTPPAKVYYYGSSDENEFDIDLKVHNKGPSYTRGAVFVSGYNPDMIRVNDVFLPEYTYRECYMDWNVFSGDGTFWFGCDDLFDFTGGSNGYWNLGLQLEDILKKKFGWNFSSFDIELSGKDGDLQGLNINFDPATVEFALHGRALIAAEPFGAGLGDLGEVYILRPDDYNFPGGDMDYMNFHSEILQWPIGVDELDQIFLITNCYLYATYAAPLVCIDPEPHSLNKKVCTPQTINWGGGQGAPVAVTSIEQENTPQKIFFTIHVSNIGTGTVYDRFSIDRCSPYFSGRTKTTDLNVITLGYIGIGNDRLNCVPEDNIIKLDSSGNGQITCSYEIRYATAKSAYKAPLVMEFWYGYQEDMQKKVHFKRVD